MELYNENYIKALRHRVFNTYYIYELSNEDITAIELMAKLECNLCGIEYNPDFLNEKSWVAVDLIDRLFEV